MVFGNKTDGTRQNRKWMYNTCLFFVSCSFLLWVETEYTVSIHHDLVHVINCSICHVQFCKLNYSLTCADFVCSVHLYQGSAFPSRRSMRITMGAQKM